MTTTTATANRIANAARALIADTKCRDHRFGSDLGSVLADLATLRDAMLREAERCESIAPFDAEGTRMIRREGFRHHHIATELRNLAATAW